MSARIVEIKAVHPGDPDRVFAEAMQFDELKSAMSGLATYDGLPDGAVAEEGQTYTVDVTLWGWLKNGGHVMHVERLDWEARLIQSREHNASVKRWDHCLTVEPHEQGALWTDRIVIDAGWQTPFTARFARYVYTYRHTHRSALSIEQSIRRA